MEAAVADGTLALSKLRPLVLGFAGGVGVPPPDLPWFCSPSLIRASTVRSKLPLSPFNTVELRLSSGKPMSRSVASFDSSPSPEVFTLDPKTRDALFTLGGDVSSPKPPRPGETGGVRFRGEVAAFRSPKPKRPVGFGGNGGGLSSELVLPVFCRVPGRESVKYIRCSYFCRMYLSMALSTSSISMGIWGLTLRGLYVLLDSRLPMRFMLSTWALSHLSMLKDLTLEMCVPSLRCRAAHRRQRKMPRLQLAHPGFLAPQSAHVLFPGTVLISSCSARSLRACWRLFRADAMFLRKEVWVARRTRLGCGRTGTRTTRGGLSEGSSTTAVCACDCSAR